MSTKKPLIYAISAPVLAKFPMIDSVIRNISNTKKKFILKTFFLNSKLWYFLSRKRRVKNMMAIKNTGVISLINNSRPLCYGIILLYFKKTAKIQITPKENMPILKARYV
jgi:hypothetical protein